MEKAFWNEQVYLAYEVASDYNLEKQIKRASKNGTLHCVDPDCEMPRLKYCHGDLKSPYFAHVENSNCDYAKYDLQDNVAMRELRVKLFECLKNKYKIDLDVKITKDHYTLLLVTLDANKKVAIEIGTKKKQISEIELLNQKYKEQGIYLQWLFATDKFCISKEDQSYFMKRYILNESVEKSVMMIDYGGQNALQYSQDMETYLSASGNSVAVPGYSDFYSETGKLSDIEVTADTIGFSGYFERFRQWKSEKKKAYENTIRGKNEVKGKNWTGLLQEDDLNNDEYKAAARNNPDVPVYRGNFKYRLCDVCGNFKKAIFFDPYKFIDNNQNVGICKMCKSKQKEHS